MQFIQIFRKGLTSAKTWNVNFASCQFCSWNNIPLRRMDTHIGNKIQLFKHTQIKGFSELSRGKLPFDNLSSLTQDVLLFSYEKTRILKYIAYFGVLQLAFWTYVGGNLYSSLRDIKNAPVPDENNFSKHSFWRSVNLGEKKFRITAFICCLAVGVITAFISFALPLRIVRHLVLCKGGNKVNVVTYGPFGRTREIQVPLGHLDCQNTRASATSYISLKIKGHRMYFLLDCRGKFNDPQLFDFTVGAAKAKLY